MKHLGVGYLLAATLLAGGATFAAAQQSAPQARPAPPTQSGSTPTGNPENGRKAFLAHGCYSCHGYWAEGGPGARLVGYPDTLLAFAAYVRQPKGAMPTFGGQVKASELTDIYAFIRSVPASPDAKTLDLLKP